MQVMVQQSFYIAELYEDDKMSNIIYIGVMMSEKS